MINSKVSCLFVFLLLISCVEKKDNKSTKEYIQENVFIETDTLSEFHKDIVTINTSLEPSYIELIDSLKERIHVSKGGFNRSGLSQNWVRMVQYNGELYPILHERISGDCLQINDSTIVIPMMEGAWPLQIVSIDNIGNDVFKIHAKEILTKTEQEDRFINIEVLSSRDGIAKFFFHRPNEQGYYMIMIDAERISSRPIIVIADTLNNRVATQFDGEPIDMYETTRLIKQSR